MDKRHQLGKDGEKLVAQKLKQNGFNIEHQNYRLPFGEIDLIARKKNLLIFVEVKRRSSLSFDLAQLITPAKQRKISLVASQYIAYYHQEDKTCRFDVALILGDQITYIENAFQSCL